MIPIDEKLKLLQPVLGSRKVQGLRQMYFFADDSREKREIEARIDLLISRLVKKDIADEIILPPPEAADASGDIDCGDIVYLGRKTGRLGLKLRDVNRHTGIFGSTGSGKTTFAMNMIRQLHKRGIPFLIFDWEKSYRNLVKEFGDVQVFTVGTGIHPLHINILDVPPGISKDEYIKSLIALIAEDYLSGAGSDTMLMNYMRMAYEEHDNPTFSHLKEVVIREITKDMKGRGRLSGRSGLWKETVQRIINFLSFGASGQVLEGDYYYPLDKLFQQNVVLELGGIQSPRDRKFIIHAVINWLFHWLQSHGTYAEQLNQAIIFEEFHNITIKGREDNLISLLFRQCRKYGMGLVAIDQTPSEIPNSIYANMNTKISFSIGTNTDLQAMSKAMNLGTFTAPFLGMLRTGQAIINIKQRHQDSFLIEPPFVPEEGNICDDELRQAMCHFADEIRKSQPEIPQSPISQAPQESDTSSPIAPLEKVFLANIAERPLDSVDERTKRLGLHPSTIAELHSSLVDKGIIKTVGVDKKKLFEITPDGRAEAEEAGIPIKKQKSRGGIEHTYWLNQTAGFLRNLEFEPVMEAGGIDLVDTAAGIAIEIETGKSDIRSNLEKLASSRFPAPFMLATSKETEIKLKRIAEPYPSIRVMFIKDFLKLTADKIISNPSNITLTPNM